MIEHILAEKSIRYFIYILSSAFIAAGFSYLFLDTYIRDKNPNIAFLIVGIIFIIVSIVAFIFAIYEFARPTIVATYNKKKIIINDKIVVFICEIKRVKKKHLVDRGMEFSCVSIYLITSHEKYKIPRIKDVDTTYHLILGIIEK